MPAPQFHECAAAVRNPIHRGPSRNYGSADSAAPSQGPATGVPNRHRHEQPSDRAEPAPSRWCRSCTTGNSKARDSRWCQLATTAPTASGLLAVARFRQFDGTVNYADERCATASWKPSMMVPENARDRGVGAGSGSTTPLMVLRATASPRTHADARFHERMTGWSHVACLDASDRLDNARAYPAYGDHARYTEALALLPSALISPSARTGLRSDPCSARSSRIQSWTYATDGGACAPLS